MGETRLLVKEKKGLIQARLSSLGLRKWQGFYHVDNLTRIDQEIQMCVGALPTGRPHHHHHQG